MDRTNHLQLTKIFAAIEGPLLNASVSSESSMRRILTVLGSDKAVVKLVRTVQSDMTGAQAVLSRMARLAGVAADYRFRNRHDTALAAYLYAIMVSSPGLLDVACRIVLTAQNTWLSNELVERIATARAHSSISNTQDFHVIYENVWGGEDLSQNARLPEWFAVKAPPLPKGTFQGESLPDLFGTLDMQTFPGPYGTVTEGANFLSQATPQQSELANDLMQIAPLFTETILPVGGFSEGNIEDPKLPWAFGASQGRSGTEPLKGFLGPKPK
jgi:hypothetical protein